MDFKIRKFLTSPRTVVFLIIITLIACLIGFFIPQIGDKSPSYFETWKEKSLYTFRIVDRLQLNSVYTSYWFLALVILITASLGYSLFLQIKRNLTQSTEYRAQNTEHRIQSTEKSFIDRNRHRIKEVFKKRRYHERTLPGNGQKFVFTKNSLGRWGSVIFHSGLLLVIASALIVLCFQKRGFVQLIEGDTFDGKENNFLVKNKGIFAGEFNTGFKTFLSKLTHTYWEGGKLKFLGSLVTVIKDIETVQKKLSINNPLFIDGTYLYQSDNYGYTLSFILKKPSGEEILSHFNFDIAESTKKPAIGKSDFPMTPYIFKMKFLPDITNKSFYLTKPILYLTVFEGSRIVFNGLIIPGNSVKIRDDILYFTGVRYWSGLIFVNNPGIILAYIGFAVGILGTGIMFLLPYKEIYLTLDSNESTANFKVSGITKRYHALFKEELDAIKKELEISSNV